MLGLNKRIAPERSNNFQIVVYNAVIKLPVTFFFPVTEVPIQMNCHHFFNPSKYPSGLVCIKMWSNQRWLLHSCAENWIRSKWQSLLGLATKVVQDLSSALMWEKERALKPRRWESGDKQKNSISFIPAELPAAVSLLTYCHTKIWNGRAITKCPIVVATSPHPPPRPVLQHHCQ